MKKTKYKSLVYIASCETISECKIDFSLNSDGRRKKSKQLFIDNLNGIMKSRKLLHLLWLIIFPPNIGLDEV